MQLQAHCQLAPSLLPTDFERPSWWGQICSSNESATERGIEGTRKGYRLSKPNIMASTAVAIGMKTFGQPVYRIDSQPLWGATGSPTHKVWPIHAFPTCRTDSHVSSSCVHIYTYEYIFTRMYP